MLTPIFQNDGITPSERFLVKLAREYFLGLWTYPNLSRVDGPRTKELADLTVIFGNHAILFSDKGGAWPKSTDISIAWKRYYRKSLRASAEELWKAESYLMRSGELFVDAKRQIPFPLKLVAENLQVHLIAVAGNSVEAGKQYFDAIAEGSSGTFMLEATLCEQEQQKHPFTIGDIDPSKTHVHVFDAETLSRVLGELGTLPDLIHYLSEKRDIARCGHFHGAAGEEELLAFYLQELSLSGFGSLAAIKRCSESSGAGVRIPEGEWKAFEKSDAYKIHCSRRKRAAEWMEILKRFDAAIIEGETGEANHVPLEIHEDTLRAAASENLASRALLAREWQDKFSSVPHNIRSSRLVRSINVPGRIYVFLFVPWIASSNSYEKYREFRLQMMHAYAQVLRLNAEWAKEAIILATEPAGNSDRRSETMLRVVYENPMTPEEVESARHLMHAENILNLVVPQSHKHPVELTRRVGRNDPCPCASGKKNKHCCEIRWLPESTVYMGML